MGGETPSTRSVILGDCPADDVLAAHLAGELVGDEAENLAAHIDTCDSCRELVVALSRGVRTEPDVLAPTRPIDTPLPHASLDLTPPSLPGAFAGRYQIKRLIGTGGMGSVYEALDLNLHRLIALKVLRLAPELPAERAEAANRLVREARAMAVLSHRNVVAVYDVGLHADQVFVAMQLVDGTTLRMWLAGNHRSPRQVLRVLADAGAGLAAAHASRIIHRDFKPDNILISRRGTARVTDFGLARRADLGTDASEMLSTADGGPDRGSRPKIVEIEADSQNVTRTGAVVGTPAYMAPEQAQGQLTDPRADQFSFCVTAWEALYGQRPFAGTTWSEIYSNVVTGTLTAPASDRGVPRAIQRALRRGLTADPGQRFESMSELLAVFDEEIRRPIRRQRVVMIALIAAAAATIAVLVYTQGKAALADDEAAPRTPEVVAPTITPIDHAPAAPAPALEARTVIDRPESSTAPTDVTAPTALPAKDRRRPPRDRAGDPASGRPASTLVGSNAPPPDPTPPAAEAQLAELATAREALVRRWRDRGLLSGDLPEAYASALRDADAALEAKDPVPAEQALARARAAIEGVAIDRELVNRKLTRLNENIERLPDDRAGEYTVLLRDVLASVNADDFPAANKKLNAIASRLGFEK